MATLYFDSVLGSDTTGDGSLANPWATYEGKFGSTASTDTCLFKRGTTQIITTSFRAPRSGSSLAAPFTMAAYGVGARPIFSFPNAAGSWGAILNGSNLSYVTLEDLDFDCSTTNATKNTAILLAAQGTGTPTGWRVRRCRFYNAGTNKSGFTLRKDTTATTATLTDVIFENCDFFNNSEHGVVTIAASGITFKKCRAWNNGGDSTQGGHGFSSRWNRTDVSSFALVSGTIYKCTLSGVEASNGVAYVQSPITNRLRLTKNTGTPTTPGIDEFGVNGTDLYINVNTNPNGLTFRYAWGRCWNITYVDCAAWGNLINSQSTFAEGNGFAFDDFTEDSVFRRCTSFSNQGRGFSVNRGDRNTIEDCLAYGNQIYGVGTNTSDQLVVRRSTFANNCQGNSIVPTGGPAEIVFSPNTTNATITQCVLVGKGTNLGIDDTAFGSGNVATYCSFSNVTGPATSLTPTNTIAGNPLLTSTYGPQVGSPLIGAGVHLAYARDVMGKQRRKPPTVGAFDRALFKSVLA